MLSVNQLNGQIKIQEIWKSLNIKKYPIQIEKQTPRDSGLSTRADTKGRLIEQGFSCLSQKSCINDAVRIWNRLPWACRELWIVISNQKTSKVVCQDFTHLGALNFLKFSTLTIWIMHNLSHFYFVIWNSHACYVWFIPHITHL